MFDSPFVFVSDKYSHISRFLLYAFLGFLSAAQVIFEENISVKAAAVFFALSFLFLKLSLDQFKLLRRGGASIKIDEEGILDTRLGPVKIPWHSVIRIRQSLWLDFTWVKVAHTVKISNPVHRLISRILGNRIYFNPWGLGMNNTVFRLEASTRFAAAKSKMMTAERPDLRNYYRLSSQKSTKLLMIEMMLVILFSGALLTWLSFPELGRLALWAGLIFSLAAFIKDCWCWKWKKPEIQISSEGLLYGKWKPALLPWSDLSDIRFSILHEYITVFLKPIEIERQNRRFFSRLLRNRLGIDTRAYDAPALDIYFAIKSMWKKNRH